MLEAFVTNKSAFRINIEHCGRMVRFGTIDIRPDHSIVFSSSLTNNTALYKVIDIGTLGKEMRHIENTGDIHATLHPRKQVAHIRKSHGEVLLEKHIQWFPVQQAFLFLRIITPPLIACPSSSKVFEGAPVIDSSYEDSLEFMLYVIPDEQRGLPVLNDDEKPFLRGQKKGQFQIHLTYRLLYAQHQASVQWREEDWFIVES